MQLHEIDDPDDDRLSDYRDLTDVALRRVREPDEGLYIAESAKVIARALAAGHRPRSILVQRKWVDDVTPLVAQAPGVDVFVVPPAVAEALTGYAVHRGALAAMHRPALRSVADTVAGARTVVVLEDIVDHTNVGAVFRNAAGLGADAVLVSPRCADPLYRRSVRVSMGTVFQVPWTRLADQRSSAAELASAGFHVAALALAGDAVPLDGFARDRPDRVALLLGSEGHGLSGRSLADADSVVTIPMAGGVDSLNVAAASAVALWALTREGR
ncbi:RNA methyltransferase [Microbacterium sp. ET2]|uniref:TrmH family RNA methyltransferase n=1 Tax=Microbacterium albipurpureum TaxID=3050384 RepID=UPI00259C844C|nr:RNA methyltransferase [Microbacterium sp. ET2 (Ac-2212)]WJL95495.1 RNA methyltransferase [Microbacterium sp. ET2 (Ac-2212)]